MSTLPRNRPNTRAKNAHQHPGQILLDGQRTRRSSAQMAADNKKAQEDLAEKVADRSAQAHHLAEVQVAQRQEREARSIEAARPLTPAQVSTLLRQGKKSVAASKPTTKGKKVSTMPVDKAPTNASDASTKSAPPSRKRANRVPKLTRAFVETAVTMIDSAGSQDGDREKMSMTSAGVVGLGSATGIQVQSSKRKADEAANSTTKKFKPAYPSGMLKNILASVPPAPPPAPSTSLSNETPDASTLPEDQGEGVAYRGYASSDEEFKNYSQVYGDKRTKVDMNNSEGLVHIEDQPEADPAPKGKRKSRSQDGLGLGKTQLRIWRTFVVPAVHEELSKIENPWDNATTDFGAIFRGVHGRFLSQHHLEYQPKSTEYNLMMQKVYGLRNQVAQSAASAVIEWFDDRGMETREAIAFEANRQTGSMATFYAVTNRKRKNSHDMVRFGLFQTDIVIKVLSAYMQTFTTSINNINWYPRGALALAVVAIEHAFSFYALGYFNKQLASSALGQFSCANYATKTLSIARSIAQLQNTEWETILAGAEILVAQSKASELIVIDDDEVDFRANLYTNPDDIDSDDFVDVDCMLLSQLSSRETLARRVGLPD
ncbi:hypothetical protein QCA50_012548 [Cerrena zonata]|uniref:Uncharacterized protein n=1 Tax=Cerrena zonata TaxID=2478898 RepID=A0AAW0FXT9_9APHY